MTFDLEPNDDGLNIMCFNMYIQRDGRSLARDRVRVIEGNLIIEDLQQADYGEYECVASNEVATLVTSTQIIVEGTKPHAPYNITASCAVFTVTLSWIPGYSGKYTFYRHEACAAYTK